MSKTKQNFPFMYSFIKLYFYGGIDDDKSNIKLISIQRKSSILKTRKEFKTMADKPKCLIITCYSYIVYIINIVRL